jgi:DNA-binding winged helix-turn-helix (wHTH) protein/pimeloyl-ACP methyl ester carboxylesterase
VRFLFADHILDTDLRELRRGSMPIAVEPQVFDLLTYLVQNCDRVVSKDDLFASVWSGRIVSDSTLASRIAAARKALGDSGEEQKLIRTVARRGIRFVGAVDCRPNGEEPAYAAGPRRPERLPASPALHKVQFCTTSDGVRIAYASVGDGPPVVWAAHWLSHLAYSWETPIWRHWIEEFAKDNAFVHYDERGNGLSDWDNPTFSVDTFVRDLEAVVDALGFDRFALIGSSKGGSTAMAYAARHPERVSHLVLLGAGAQGWRVWGNGDEIERREAIATLTRQGWAQDNPAFRQILTSVMLPDATVEEMGWFNDLQRISSSAENAARLQQSLAEINVVDFLPSIAAPTLVLHCREDAAVPFEQGRLIASRIPGARLVALESRNHVLLPRDPAWAAFVSEVRRFLRQEEPMSR